MKKIIFLIILIFLGISSFFIFRKIYLREVPVKLYFYSEDSRYLVAYPVKVKAGKNLPLNILNSLIKGPEKNSNLVPTLPKNLKILSLKIKDKIAYVNFSKDLISYGGGATYEIGVVSSIVLTLTELKDIEGVQFLIEGEKIKYLPEGTEIFSPLKRKIFEKYIKK